MGKLGETFHDRVIQKIDDVITDAEETMAGDPDLAGTERNYRVTMVNAERKETDTPDRFTERWIDDICRYLGFECTNDTEKVGKILDKLRERDGYCPCSGKSEKTICPCEKMREHNICTCGLFISASRRKMSAFTSATISRD